MQPDHWKFDRDDIICPNCRDTCYMKYRGISYWECACCGWRYPPTTYSLSSYSQENKNLIVIDASEYGLDIPEGPYFIFNLLPLEDILDQPVLSTQHSQEFLRSSFLRWLRIYQDHAKSFYLSQYVRHLEYIFDRFNQENNLDYEFSPDAFAEIKDDRKLAKQWADAQEKANLDNHQQSKAQSHKVLDLYIKFIATTISPPFTEEKEQLLYLKSYQMKELVGNYEDDEILFPTFNQMWFEKIVVNETLEQQISLRKLPYLEYLRSSHARRLRAARMLLNDERCEACFIRFTNLPNGREDLHLRHKTYDNIGNERYQDLILLCTSCHKQFHQS